MRFYLWGPETRPCWLTGGFVSGHCCVDGARCGGRLWRMKRRACRRPIEIATCSAFRGFRFPPDVIVLAVRWYLRYSLSYRDVEELLAERGIIVDHVTLYRWVQRFTPLLADIAVPSRHAVGSRWFVDETYVKVAGIWRYVYRAVDEYGPVIDVCVSTRRDTRAATTFFAAALLAHGEPEEVVTDRAPALVRAIAELFPGAFHNTDQYANNRVECDHGRLKARLRTMRSLKTMRTASVVIRGHALMQNIRRGHYELGVEASLYQRVATAFTELARTI
jgi:IS6 family transposase